MNRLTQFDLIRRNLGRKPFRTGMLAAVVALFSFSLFCGTLLGQSVGNGTRLLAERLGADVMFVPYGYDTQIRNSLLRGEPSSFYLDGRLGRELRDETVVEKATAQLFIATLKAACCSMPVQLIGIDPETDFVVNPWMLSVLTRPLAEDEAVVGNKITGEAGDSIRLFGREFAIAAKLDATGMGFDSSVFMDIDRARRLLLLSDLGPFLELPEGVNRNSFVSSVLVKIAPGVEIKEAVNALSGKYAIEYNLDFVAVPDMISDIASRLGALSNIFYGIAGLLWLLAVCVLGLVFSAIIQERKKEFGVLRVIGASRADLSGIVLREALLISGGGAFIGVAAGCLALFPFNAYIDSLLPLPSLRPGLTVLLGVGLGAFLLGLVVGPLACLPAIRRLGRLDVYLALREE